MSYSLLKNTWGIGPETIKTEPIKCLQPWPDCHNKNINSWFCKTLQNGKKSCTPSHKPPSAFGSNDVPFRYSTMEECNSYCNPLPPSYNSFICRTNRNGQKMCVPDQRPPSAFGSKDVPFRYSTIEECNSYCNTLPPSYNSFICRTNMNGQKMCVPDQRPPGGSGSPTDPFRYSTIEECNSYCSNIQPTSYRCTSISGRNQCISDSRRPNNINIFGTIEECTRACNLLPIPKRWSCITSVGAEGICMETDYGEYASQNECINSCNGGSGSG